MNRIVITGASGAFGRMATERLVAKVDPRAAGAGHPATQRPWPTTRSAARRCASATSTSRSRCARPLRAPTGCC